LAREWTGSSFIPDMTEGFDLDNLLAETRGYRDKLVSMRERILADAVMIGEIPSPTFGEARLVQFIRDRFTENGLDKISVDEKENVSAVLPGKTGKRNILVAAHLDKIWEPGIDHSVAVTTDSLIGPGVADNALGVAAVTSLPSLFESLEVELDANLIFLGTTRSMGRGNLEGLSFFVDHTKMPIHSAICLEGIQIGRLSYASLGMNRGEVVVRTPEERDWESWSLSGAITGLTKIIQKMLAIELPQSPKTSIILGSIQAGTAYSSPPTEAALRFEVRSEEPGMVSRIRQRIESIIEEVNAETRVSAELRLIAQRVPGTIGFDHPLVATTRQLMKTLEITPKIAPSTSELSVLLNKKIPSLTLGISDGDRKNHLDETVRIQPMFTGLAQVIGVLEAIDGGVCDEEN